MSYPSFDNRFVRELPGERDATNHVRAVHGALWSPVTPTPVAAPKLLGYSQEMVEALGLDAATIASPEWVAALSGNAVLPGMTAYATNYGGHQFGHWAGQLGDGRAISLGELLNSKGERWELQLKGAGRTPYSRSADGRAVLRSSLREFLCSEAMHHLGVPTTRALSLVGTGELVERDMFYDGNPVDEPGAIVCRVSPSFIRFGHFELPASRGEHVLLRQLVAFTISRDFPDLAVEPDAPFELRLAAMFKEVCVRTARLMVHWMRVGFVHGVMNTDNMSITGLTIDYGPYGWVDNFDPSWTPNTTDAKGRRYAYGRQPEIARWNLERLMVALQGLTFTPAALQAGLYDFDDTFAIEASQMYAQKFGFKACEDADPAFINAALTLLRRAEMDMPRFFRTLATMEPEASVDALFASASYNKTAIVDYEFVFKSWLRDYHKRVAQDGTSQAERAERMNRVNPCYVPRNYLAQEAIDKAAEGDMSQMETLMEVLRKPYTEQAGCEHFAQMRPDWAREKAGCSMLSCSS